MNNRSPETVFLSTAYLAPVEYYCCLNLYSQAVIETHEHYVKQSYRNRCIIASANGLQTLSIPVEKTENQKCFTKDIRISDHGDWRHLHWNAIVSAYNSSPFFEYYEDDFRPFYEKKQTFLLDFNESLREMICRLIDIEPRVLYSGEYRSELSPGEIDLRETIHPKRPGPGIGFRSYYQVFFSRFGFQPNLSIIDLLFNMGPEAILYVSSDPCPPDLLSEER